MQQASSPSSTKAVTSTGTLRRARSSASAKRRFFRFTWVGKNVLAGSSVSSSARLEFATESELAALASYEQRTIRTWADSSPGSRSSSSCSPSRDRLRRCRGRAQGGRGSSPPRLRKRRHARRGGAVRARGAARGCGPRRRRVPRSGASHGRLRPRAEAILVDATQDALAAFRARKDHARVVGPGLGATARTDALVRGLLREDRASAWVLDADALNVLRGELGLLRGRTAPTILTPHPGEAARLLGREIPRDEAGRVAAAKEIGTRSAGICCLKGIGP